MPLYISLCWQRLNYKEQPKEQANSCVCVKVEYLEDGASVALTPEWHS